MKPAPRATVLAPDLRARGGAERVALAFAAALRDLGYVVQLAVAGDAASVEEVSRYLGVDVSGVEAMALPEVKLLCGLESLRTVLEERSWVRHIRRNRPDLFVNCLFDATPVIPDAFNVYYVHFPHQPRPLRLPGVRGFYVRASESFRRALNGGRDFREAYGMYLANSLFTAGHVKELWGVEAEVLYPPCELIDTRGDVVDRERCILAVGRFQEHSPGRPHKNHAAMIEAFRRMPDLHAAGWSLRLVGSVGSRAEVERLQRHAQGLPVTFHMDLPLDELHEMYRTAQVYWHAQGFGHSTQADPQAQEHFGITVVEAMSAGLLPVVFASGGPSEIIEGTAGAFSWTSIDDLVEQTRHIAGSPPDLRREWRTSVRSRAQYFGRRSFDRSVGQILGAQR